MNLLLSSTNVKKIFESIKGNFPKGSQMVGCIKSNNSALKLFWLVKANLFCLAMGHTSQWNLESIEDRGTLLQINLYTCIGMWLNLWCQVSYLTTLHDCIIVLWKEDLGKSKGSYPWCCLAVPVFLNVLRSWRTKLLGCIVN